MAHSLKPKASFRTGLFRTCGRCSISIGSRSVMPRRKDESGVNAGSADKPGFTRRSFLKTVGASGVAAGVLARAPGVGAQGVNAVGPGAVPMTLNINGQVHRLELEPRVTLLDAL